MTTEEVIDRGLAASSLLSNPTFQSVVRSIGVECFAAFTETKPSEADKREHTYNLYQGLKAIEAELNARIQAQEEAVKALDAQLEDQDETEGPIFIQGNTDQ